MVRNRRFYGLHMFYRLRRMIFFMLLTSLAFHFVRAGFFSRLEHNLFQPALHNQRLAND